MQGSISAGTDIALDLISYVPSTSYYSPIIWTSSLIIIFRRCRSLQEWSSGCMFAAYQMPILDLNTTAEIKFIFVFKPAHKFRVLDYACSYTHNLNTLPIKRYILHQSAWSFRKQLLIFAQEKLRFGCSILNFFISPDLFIGQWSVSYFFTGTFCLILPNPMSSMFNSIVAISWLLSFVYGLLCSVCNDSDWFLM